MKGIKYYYKLLKHVLRQHGFITVKEFFTFHLRPKKADMINEYIPENMPKVGIVIQGPLRKEDNFTIETVKLYKKYYPESTIIVSTWDTESGEDLAEIESLCELCVSHFDKQEGNFQRTTSLAGIKKAQELGCEYVLKTRTDQRAYASQILSYMIKLMSDYPLNIKCSSKGRLVVCEKNTFKNRLYNISDMFIFGYIEDVRRYFSCPLFVDNNVDESTINTQDYMQYQIEYSKLRWGEIWFASHYIESLGFTLKWTFDDSDYYRNELFIIVDDNMLDLYWPKYDKSEYRWKEYCTKNNFHQVSFREWYLSQNKRL